MRNFLNKLFKRTQNTTTASPEAPSIIPQKVEETEEDLEDSFNKLREKASSQIPKNKKDQLRENYIGESFTDLNTLFSEVGKVFVIPKGFPLVEALDQLVNILSEQEGIEVELVEVEVEKLWVVQFRDLRTFRKVLKLTPNFHFYIALEGKELSYALGISEWLKKDGKPEAPPKSVGAFNQFYSIAVIKYWEEIVWACVQQYYAISINNAEILAETFIFPKGRYVKELKEHHVIWLLAQVPFPGDTLAWLPISEMITPTSENDKKVDFFFHLTTHKTQIVGFNQQGKPVTTYYLSQKAIEVEDGMGRNKLTQGKYNWYSFYKYNVIFEEIVEVITETEPSIRLKRVALLNWHNKASEVTSNEFALQLMRKCTYITDDIFDELTVAFLVLASKDRKVAVKSYITHYSLAEIIEKVVMHPTVEKELPQWVTTWKLSLQDTITILHLCLRFGKEQSQLVKLLKYHRNIREQFFSNKKNTYQTPHALLFEIQFCEHLLMANLPTEALELLEQIKESIPDETLADLLPPNNVNLSENGGGPPIKIRVLDLIIQAKGFENSKAERFELTKLQPLNKSRLKQFLQINDDERSSLKAKEAIRILAHDGMSNYYLVNEERGICNTIPAEEINTRLPHPSTKEKGAFHQIKTWIASTKVPDYSHLKSYSERLGTDPSHQMYLDILADVQICFGMNGVEAYVARGEKGVGIQAFEGPTNFIIIGGEHLSENSVFFMNPSELRFAIGAEMAHLYFKHARITAQDVWQGAWQKGKVVLDTLLTGASALQAVTSVIGKTAKLGNLLRQTEKMSSIAISSTDIVKWLSETNNTYKENDTLKTHIQVEDQLLATSRLLQLTADRSGLLMCGSLHAAIRAILLTQRGFAAELPVAQRYGLSEVITRQNENGEFVFQHLAIRIASLIQFYISEDYQVLEKHLLDND